MPPLQEGAATHLAWPSRPPLSRPCIWLTPSEAAWVHWWIGRRSDSFLVSLPSAPYGASHPHPDAANLGARRRSGRPNHAGEERLHARVRLGIIPSAFGASGRGQLIAGRHQVKCQTAKIIAAHIAAR